MFNTLKSLCSKPKAFEKTTVADLWTDPHRATQMLSNHLNPQNDWSSRNHEFINTSVNWIWNYFDLGSESRIADFGCGPGMYTSSFAKRGAKVTGIDFSENSLEYAKSIAQKQSLDITYHHMNYLDFDSNDTFDLITLIF
jgi:2-polyprenyl-3-methyl-5-hydroxy-6-metoxy-1,4-benzoquinol methylase